MSLEALQELDDWSKAVFGNKHFARVLLAIDSISAGEVHVREVAAQLGVADPIVRSVFKRLADAGLLDQPLRDDRRVSYRVDKPALKRFVRVLPTRNSDRDPHARSESAARQ